MIQLIRFSAKNSIWGDFMKKMFFFVLFLSPYLYATTDVEMVKLTKELDIYAGSKAIVQWERVFASQRHLKRYKLEKFSKEKREELKLYLIKHAADSQQPIVPGL